MLEAEQLIARYERLAQISSAMLATAQQRDWERLDALGVSFLETVDAIKTADLPPPTLSADQRLAKGHIIRQILANDRAIRDITEPWMRELQALMHSVGTQRKLQRAYG